MKKKLRFTILFATVISCLFISTKTDNDNCISVIEYMDTSLENCILKFTIGMF